jgi:hypothetical protein
MRSAKYRQALIALPGIAILPAGCGGVYAAC